MELPDLADFRGNVADVSTFLKALQTILPSRVDDDLIKYLDAVQGDKVSLEFLRNATAKRN